VSARFAVSTLAALLLGVLSAGCEEQTIEVELHSLQASGEVSFVCRRSDGIGIDRSQCPDFEDEGNKMFALVTQTSTQEVAVIDTQEGVVVDLDSSTPGYAFLRVPSKPENIASTPGGAASFVTISGEGKDGITAIPTTCISRPKANETMRDVTSFASCHLPATPGDIAVVIAPPEADGTMDGTIRESCDAASGPESQSPLGASLEEGGTRSECGANLTLEHEDANGNDVGPRGRRKLAVALPDRGEIAIIDAQWLLDQVPGNFPECAIEATHRLQVELGPAGTQQRLDDAPELRPRDGCVIEEPTTPPRPATFQPRPAGFGASGELLYVADEWAPVIHVLDVSNPCSPNELPPLLPMSFNWPSRVVTTSRLAASPLTPDNKRYVYAIDQYDQPPSLMAFDVSPGSTDRTPLVRPNSLRIPEPPDRLQLGTPIADVAFALRDIETTDPETGVAESGVRCDPNFLTAPPGSPAAQHRPTSDQSRGAQPRLLRGLFGLAMLTSGHVAIIDVDDFDSPCRRPYTTNPNPSPDEDFRGCSDDAGLPEFLTLDGTTNTSLTVTNEVSCGMVSPHRFRSALMGRTNSTDGAGAPTLAAFPEFQSDSETADRPAPDLPKLLAVSFEPAVKGDPAPPPEAYIGTTLHRKGSATAELPTDPNTSTIASLTIPFVEPRAIPAAEGVSLTYEGALTIEYPSGSFIFDPDDPVMPMRFEDASAQFCDRGVYDLEMLGDLGTRQLGVSDETRDVFAAAHADVVEVSAKLLASTDHYWISERFLDPESEGGCGLDYGTCIDTFGDYDPPDVSPNRRLSVIEAYQDVLVVEPEDPTPEMTMSDEEKRELAKRLECCFPHGVSYRVHARKQWVLIGTASGLRSDVTARPATFPDGGVHYRCERDCDPKKQFWNARVFEVASSVDCTTVLGPARCAVGRAEPNVDPCAYDPCVLEDPLTGCTRFDGGLDLDIDTGATSCIHSGITSRFAVYRGLQPSVRGMSFSWQVTGGFRPLISSIAAVSVAVMPQHVQYVPELQRIALVDGAQLGLSLISLDSLRVEEPWPVY
jgi:hypothetical protein